MIKIALSVITLCVIVGTISILRLYHHRQDDPVISRTVLLFSWLGATVFGPMLLYVEMATPDTLTLWIFGGTLVATSAITLATITEGIIHTSLNREYTTTTNNY